MNNDIQTQIAERSARHLALLGGTELALEWIAALRSQ